MARPFDDVCHHNKVDKNLDGPLPQLWSETQQFGQNLIQNAVKTVEQHPVITGASVCIAGILIKNPGVRGDVVELLESVSARGAVAVDDAVMGCRRKIEFPVIIIGRGDGLHLSQPASSSFSQAYIRARQSVARVMASQLDANGECEAGTATAFAVSKDGRFITNYHVVENKNTFNLIDRFGKPHFAKVVGTDPMSDLAVLKLERRSALPLFKPLNFGQPLAPGYHLNPKEEAFSFGYGGTDRLTGAMKSNIRVAHSDPLPRLSADETIVPIQSRPGNSGSPVMDRHGDVIGIVKSIPPKGTLNHRTLSCVVPGNIAEDLLADSNKIWTRPSPAVPKQNKY